MPNLWRDSHTTIRKYLPRAIPWLITALLVVFLVGQRDDWQGLPAVLARARWSWLALGMLCQAASNGAMAWLNALLLRQYGVDVPWPTQYAVQLAMAFVETVIPSASISGFALRYRLLKPYGLAADVAAVTLTVEIALLSLSVVSLALIVGAWNAIIGSTGGAAMLGRLGLLLVGIAGLVFGAAWQWRRDRFDHIRNRIGGWFCRTWDRRVVSRFPKRLAEWPASRLLERMRHLIAQLVSLFRDRPGAIVAGMVGRTGLEALGFVVCFYAFDQRLPLSTLLLLYILTLAGGSLNLIGAIGLVEVSLAALYMQFGIEPESAVAVMLAYRLTDYWLPRLSGAPAWLWLERSLRLSEPLGGRSPGA